MGLLCASVFVFYTSSSFAQKKKITLEDIFLRGTFATQDVPGFTPVKNENYYTGLETISQNGSELLAISVFDMKGNKQKTLLEIPHKLFDGKEGELHDYVIDPTETKILLYFNGENIYRRSILYNVYLVDLKTNQWLSIADEKILHATLSPNGDKVAYVKDNNLYVYHIPSSETRQITFDGRRNHIINGNCDWVYEEEFSFTRAYEWAPDGKRIAFYRFDESNVKEYAMTRYNGLYPEQYIYKYPKAGEDNSLVEIKVVDLDLGTIHNVDLGPESDQYIPRIYWANKNELAILRLNRLQNKLDYLFYHVQNKETKNELTDDNPYYVDILDPLIFIEQGSKMIFQSERDGYNHLYCLNRKTGKVKQITKGRFDVDNVLGFNAKSRKIYYTAGKKLPTQRELYAVSIDNNEDQLIVGGNGWVTAMAFPSSERFMVRLSSISQVPHYYIIDDKGEKIATLEKNEALQQKMNEYNLGTLKPVVFKSADGLTDLYGWAIYPPDFDKNRKYPVLMYQYSGPGSQEVRDFFPLGNYWWHQYMAQEGYIVVCVDGRGTGARGQEFKKCTYLQLGKLESEDQIAVAQQLQTWKFVDAQRIGIWGWSYGGFMSATCILKGNEVFKTAVSVAPVTNWRYYDNIYTERFMRTPQENPKGYDDNSPINMAGRLKGNLLIIHGTADDNVHFQNAVMLTKALIEKNKQFESIYYPEKDHGIRGGTTRYQLFTKITNYIKNNL